MFAHILKFNPNHDAAGRFASSQGAGHGKGKETRATARARATTLHRLRASGVAGSTDSGTEGEVPRNYGRGARSLRSLNGVEVATEEFIASDAAKKVFGDMNYATPTMLQLSGDNAAKAFSAAMVKAKAANPNGAAVYVYPEEEYAKMKMFLSEDGHSGIAVKENGDIVSVFSTPGKNKGFAVPALHLATENGGTHLDCFDTVLPSIYAYAGFRTTARLKWDDGEAPDGWDKKQMQSFNNGEPDVVFMAFDKNRSTIYTSGEGRTVSTYDGAVQSQLDFVGNQKTTAKKVEYAIVIKGNPFRDMLGRFTSKAKAFQRRYENYKDKISVHEKRRRDRITLPRVLEFALFGKINQSPFIFKDEEVTLASVLKANPYHDEAGRFASKDSAAWAKVGGRLGSNPGGLFLHKGKKHYVKFPQNPNQVHAEEAADKIYEMMGVESMQHQAIPIRGKTASASVWKNVEPLGEQGWKELNDAQVQQAANAYVASALTNNWDVVGLTHDNMGTTTAGKLAILDTGGSFTHRAMGKPKDFSPDPLPELVAMMSKDKTSGRAFGPLMRDKEHFGKFIKAAERLASIPNEKLLEAVQGMGKDAKRDEALIGRKNAILDFFGIRAAKEI